MRVLTFTSLFPNSEKTNLGIFIKRRMHAYSQREGCDIRVVVPVPYFPKIPFVDKYAHFSKIPTQEVMDGIIVYYPRYPLIPKISMRFHGKLIFHATKGLVNRIFKEFPFDLIDGHFVFPDCQAAVMLGNKLDVPVVSSARGSDINEFIFYPSIRPQIVETLRKSSKVISVCQSLKEMMVSQGIDESIISVIPNGIDSSLFFPIDKGQAAKKIGLDRSRKTILSVGALITRKGHDLTINSVRSLVKKGYNVQLYIIGSGDQQKNLKKLINKLGLEDRVFLTGQIPNKDLYLWYNASDVFCLASSREGWANVLTESLACGTPVVATSVFGAGEIVRNQSMGILVQRSHDSIFQGLEMSLNSKWDQMAISGIMRERTWEVVANEVDSAFHEAVKKFNIITSCR